RRDLIAAINLGEVPQLIQEVGADREVAGQLFDRARPVSGFLEDDLVQLLSHLVADRNPVALFFAEPFLEVSCNLLRGGESWLQTPRPMSVAVGWGQAWRTSMCSKRASMPAGTSRADLRIESHWRQ